MATIRLECDTAALPPVAQRALAAAGVQGRFNLAPPPGEMEPAEIIGWSPLLMGAWTLGRLAEEGRLEAPGDFGRRARNFSRFMAKTTRKIVRRSRPGLADEFGEQASRRATKLLARAEPLWPA